MAVQLLLLGEFLTPPILFASGGRGYDVPIMELVPRYFGDTRNIGEVADLRGLVRLQTGRRDTAAQKGRGFHHPSKMGPERVELYEPVFGRKRARTAAANSRM